MMYFLASSIITLYQIQILAFVFTRKHDTNLITSNKIIKVNMQSIAPRTAKPIKSEFKASVTDADTIGLMPIVITKTKK